MITAKNSEIKQIEGLENELNSINDRLDLIAPQNILITAAQFNFSGDLIANCINTVEWLEGSTLKQTQYNSDIVLLPKPLGLLKRFTIFYILLGSTDQDQQIYAREGIEAEDPQMVYVTTGEFLVGTALIDATGSTPIETTNLENCYHFGAGGSDLNDGRTSNTRFASAEKAYSAWVNNRNYSIFTNNAGTFAFNVDLSVMTSTNILNIFAPHAIFDWSDIPLQISAGTVRMTLGRGVGEINVLNNALLRFNTSTVLRCDINVVSGGTLYAPQLNQCYTLNFASGSIIRIGQAECGTLIQNSTDIIAIINGKFYPSIYRENYPEMPAISEGKYLKDTGLFSEIEIPSGGYSNNLYFDETASDVAGYETLNYNVNPLQSIETWSVNASEGDKLMKNYLYPSAVSTDNIPAGFWSFTFFGKVDNASGDTRIGITYFARHTNGSETDLFTVWSDEINNTIDAWIKFGQILPTYTVLTTDRMGARVKTKTTSVSNKTITYYVGDGFGAFLNNPNRIRHNQLRALNQDFTAQHIDQSTEKTTIIDADSAAIWDSVSLKFVRTSLTNFKTFLGLTYQTILTFSTNLETDKLSTTKVSSVKYIYDFFGKLSTINVWSLLQTFTSGILINSSLNIKIGEYTYNAVSATADAVNDTRSKVVAGVQTTEICTVLSATKGAGTWVALETTSTTGQKTLSNLAGTNNRIVQSSSTGIVSATSEIIFGKLSDTTAINILINVASWDVNGLFIGTQITGTFEGQYYANADYYFFAYSDNEWIRILRG